MSQDKPEYTVCAMLRQLGCRKHRNGTYFILDGFDGQFYLLFDATDNPERPETHGTVDIHVAKIGSFPTESCDRLCVLSDCREIDVLRFMFALGVSRFSETTRKAMYDASDVVGTRTA